MVKALVNRSHSVDLAGHHALCEMNFHQFIALLPGLRSGKESWNFHAGVTSQSLDVKIQVLEAAPYTTTIEVEQSHETLDSPRIVVRLYHDVSMAEIISWDHHRHWKPQYQYPNANMYHPDEKLALNQFLGDWLKFCRKQGFHPIQSVIQFT